MSIVLSLWRIINPLALLVTRNESARQFLSLKLDEQKKLLSDLANFRTDAPSKGNYQKWSFYFETIRQHFQLPCTAETRQNRAQLLEELCGRDGKILLLGDDDLVSWELAKRDFSDVCAADFDQKLLDHIRDLCADLTRQPRLIQGDFSDPAFDPGVAPDVVSLDPPYNLRWTHIFISKALEAVESREKAILLLMINPYCFSPKDLENIMERLASHGFRLKERRERFNGYPLQGLSQVLLRAGLRLLDKVPTLEPGQQFCFSSDLYIFHKG
ncbi:MAG: bis-aminopropyl spermidine synthase family protein [Chitinophagaceae bacterium]|nr:bis-aminopropyl spermidine synthase family protein [Oligoflexus sp.]